MLLLIKDLLLVHVYVPETVTFNMSTEHLMKVTKNSTKKTAYI